MDLSAGSTPSGEREVAIEAAGGAIAKAPYNDAHERRVVVYDSQGNGLVFYSPLPR